METFIVRGKVCVFAICVVAKMVKLFWRPIRIIESEAICSMIWSIALCKQNFKNFLRLYS